MSFVLVVQAECGSCFVLMHTNHKNHRQFEASVASAENRVSSPFDERVVFVEVTYRELLAHLQIQLRFFVDFEGYKKL